MSKVFTRSDMPVDGVDDMICLSDLSEGSLLWNLKIRYENNQIYVRELISYKDFLQELIF